ncbi:MAG: OmpA family protein [Muribaculaceae bacterium]|nr:OmpA family protein [Muribaculaceae bacterium]
MLKRILKIGMLASVMMCSISAFAQEEQPAQKEYRYPNYGFWSNWSVGGDIGLSVPFEENSHVAFPDLNIFLHKDINNVWGARLQFGMHNSGIEGLEGYFAFDFVVTFSIIDAIKGYDPERPWKLYALGLTGLALDGPTRLIKQVFGKQVGEAEQGSFLEDYGYFGFEGGLGIAASYAFSERWNAAVEATYYVPGQPENIFNRNSLKFSFLSISAGVAYNLGVTPTDKVRLAQEAMLTQENFDALTQERDQVKGELEVAKKSERALQEKVATLEKNHARAEKLAKNEGELKKLKDQIEKIKKEQLNFYALPLSILYAVDQYNVPAGEMGKMKAIARVMKDNPDYKFTIVGFADYTGSPEYNQKLSVKRAEEAKKVLVKKYGIAEDRLIVDGKGQGSSFGDVKLSINRRVSFYRVIE